MHDSAARFTTRALTDFLSYAVNSGMYPNRVLQTLALLIERFFRGEKLRVVVSTPPRHGKTETLLMAFAYILARMPELTSAYATYADRFAKSKSRKSRNYALELGVDLATDSRNLNEWRTLSGGGLRTNNDVSDRQRGGSSRRERFVAEITARVVNAGILARHLGNSRAAS